jgi:hypothetical protein
MRTHNSAPRESPCDGFDLAIDNAGNECCTEVSEMKRLIVRLSGVVVLFGLTVTPGVEAAEQTVGSGAVEKVVSHAAQTTEGEQEVIETYSPSLEAGRLWLSRIVRRAKSVTSAGTQTVEDTEERNPAAPSDSLRLVRRIVTTERKTGAELRVIERRVFEPDLNGRLVLVVSQTEHTSSK